MVQEPLFKEKQEIIDRRLPIGNGYALEWASSKILKVYRYGVLFKNIEIKAAIDKRRLVVELVLEGGVKKYKLAKALDVSRQSIDNWINIFKKAGFEGLVNSYKGGRRSGRKEKMDRLPVGNKARQLEEDRRHRREAIQKQQLLIEFQADNSKDRAGDGGKADPRDIRIAECIEGVADEGTEVVKDTKEMEGQCDIEPAQDDGEDADGHLSELRLPDLFKETYDFHENRYAGSFLYWGIFQHVFNFMDLCESIFERYSTAIYLFAMMLINRIESVEQMKTVYKREFGKLIGVKKLFSKPTLWKIIHGVCNFRSSRLLIEEFFKYQARNSLVVLYWLYIDGHFIPYYGKHQIHKGFYTQRDEMMPGQTEMFVHDCQGQIVYFEIQEGKGDLKEMMRRMSRKWSAYIGETAPLIIADRESWGVEHFLSMAGYRFVTWERFSKAEELASIPEEAFGEVFRVNDTDYQAVEDKKVYSDDKGNSIELRRIVIWNRSTGRRIACVTQDEEEDTIRIAIAMLGRWGCSENSFKHMGERFNLHYSPVVDASKESNNQEISNPEVNKLKKEIGALKKKLAKFERHLGRMPLTTNKDGSLRKSKKRERLQKEQAELKEKLAKAEKKLKDCPERVKLEEVSAGASFKELDTEGKNLWDLAETLVWNSRKKLIHMFKEFLPNTRDLIPVLEAITNCRGWVRSTREAIEIRLEPLERPGFRAAQIQLCRALNEKNIRLKNGKRLLYDVGLDPESVQNNRS